MGDVCIAIECLPLGYLNKYLEISPPLPEGDARQIAFQSLQGLALMHDGGSFHRLGGVGLKWVKLWIRRLGWYNLCFANGHID